MIIEPLRIFSIPQTSRETSRTRQNGERRTSFLAVWDQRRLTGSNHEFAHETPTRLSAEEFLRVLRLGPEVFRKLDSTQECSPILDLARQR